MFAFRAVLLLVAIALSVMLTGCDDCKFKIGEVKIAYKAAKPEQTEGKDKKDKDSKKKSTHAREWSF